MASELELISALRNIETIAEGTGIRELRRLRELYGQGRWRKLKGSAWVRMPSGRVRLCEVHWYEAHGIGRRKLKIKRFLD